MEDGRPLGSCPAFGVIGTLMAMVSLWEYNVREKAHLAQRRCWRPGGGVSSMVRICRGRLRFLWLGVESEADEVGCARTRRLIVPECVICWGVVGELGTAGRAVSLYVEQIW